MPSDNGSQGLPADRPKPIVIPPDEAARRSGTPLTTEEQDRIAAGEPYCFRCGKPASSFPEYSMWDDLTPHDPAGYVRSEEGTYNPNTNRFACDECYIAIGMPVGEPGNDYGWKAP